MQAAPDIPASSDQVPGSPALQGLPEDPMWDSAPLALLVFPVSVHQPRSTLHSQDLAVEMACQQAQVVLEEVRSS